MLEIKPPKIAWPIGTFFGSLIFAALNYLTFLESKPSGTLKEVKGELTIFNAGRYNFPMVSGAWGVARCDLIACSRSSFKNLSGKEAIAKIDDNNKIFNLEVDGLVQISSTALQENRNRTGLMVLAAIFISVGALFYTFKIWSKK